MLNTIDTPEVCSEVLTHLPDSLAQQILDSSFSSFSTSSSSLSASSSSFTKVQQKRMPATTTSTTIGHYLDDLEGCGTTDYATVNVSFIALFSNLTEAFNESNNGLKQTPTTSTTTEQNGQLLYKLAVLRCCVQ